jgi:hypothetical protein
VRFDAGLKPGEQVDFDHLELELRKLPSVVAVGFEGPSVDAPVSDDAVLTVHVLVSDLEVRSAVEQTALDLGRLHLGRPLRVIVAPEGDGEDAAEVVMPIPPPVILSRVRLVDVALVESGRYVEVALAHGDLRAIGRGPAGTPGGAAGATLVALRQLGWAVPFSLGSGVRLAVGATGAVLIHLVGPDGDRLGVSVGDTAEQAAVKATLQALNRWLDDPARRPAGLRPVAPAS